MGFRLQNYIFSMKNVLFSIFFCIFAPEYKRSDYLNYKSLTQPDDDAETQCHTPPPRSSSREAAAASSTLHTPHSTHLSLSLSLSTKQGVLSDLGHFRSPPLRWLSARPTLPYYIYSPTKLVRSVPSKEDFGSMLRMIFSIPMPKNFLQGAAKFPSGRKEISFREEKNFFQGENFAATGSKKKPRLININFNH